MQVKIGILNIMHDKVDTQKRFRHVLADADLTFFYSKTHYQKRQLPAAFAKIAEPLDLVKVGTMDAFIITGAPIEQIPFDQVDYWDELRQLFAFLDEKQIPQLYVCWGAMAALNYFYGIGKDALAGKLFGIYRQQILQPTPLLAGLASGFKAPHARYAEMSHQDLAKQPELTVNAISETGNLCLVTAKTRPQVFLFSHLEYGPSAFIKEYDRELAARGGDDRGLSKPQQYFADEKHMADPQFTWEETQKHFFANWLASIQSASSCKTCSWIAKIQEFRQVGNLQNN